MMRNVRNNCPPTVKRESRRETSARPRAHLSDINDINHGRTEGMPNSETGAYTPREVYPRGTYQRGIPGRYTQGGIP